MTLNDGGPKKNLGPSECVDLNESACSQRSTPDASLFKSYLVNCVYIYVPILFLYACSGHS